MNEFLVISIYFYQGRYHGDGLWPPAPARLFQALLAGTARGSQILKEDEQAFRWLEKINPPIIATPRSYNGQTVKNYVPNNDLDTVGGDPQRIGEIRTAKSIKPHLFDHTTPLLFIWPLKECTEHERAIAEKMCELAKNLYQLGRGVDMAYAHAMLLQRKETQLRLTKYGDSVYYPSFQHQNHQFLTLYCPQEGSYESLKQRFTCGRSRFSFVDKKRAFTQPPKARFRRTVYKHNLGLYHLFEMRKNDSQKSFHVVSIQNISQLTITLRDQVCEKLKAHFPDQSSMIDQVVVGRNSQERDKLARIRIIALPSIGHEYADQNVRRILVEIGANCPIPAQDIHWAFMQVGNVEEAWSLVESFDKTMTDHYGIGNTKTSVWESVTPVAVRSVHLPSPSSGEQRKAWENKVKKLLKQALLHGGITTEVLSIHVQPEPFSLKGKRANKYSFLPRFRSNQLHHVRIVFAQPVSGPVVIGDGRYLGLGIMAPGKDEEEFLNSAFALDLDTSHHKISISDRVPLLRAFRRALMSLAKNDTNEVSKLFSGHENNGSPSQSREHQHVFLACDYNEGTELIERIMIVAPWKCYTNKSTQCYQKQKEEFVKIVRSIHFIKAGKLGVIRFQKKEAMYPNSAFIKPSQRWKTRTPYLSNRNKKSGQTVEQVVIDDVHKECHRRGLPEPIVTITTVQCGPKGGNIRAHIYLEFKTMVHGPLMLGRDSHFGGGLFTGIT